MTANRQKPFKFIPTVESHLHSGYIKIPAPVYDCSGININGKRIKSLLFTTDVALIHNHNAHAIMAVYPFTPQLSITKAILEMASVPVFAGVGGGITSGPRAVHIALQAELFGATAVVVNAPMPLEVVRAISQAVDIPVVATVVSRYEEALDKLQAGASILNISGAAKTAELVAQVREEVGIEVPIIATGGPTEESLLATIHAGANAITITPPSTAELFSESMKRYRQALAEEYEKHTKD